MESAAQSAPVGRGRRCGSATPRQDLRRSGPAPKPLVVSAATASAPPRRPWLLRGTLPPRSLCPRPSSRLSAYPPPARASRMLSGPMRVPRASVTSLPPPPAGALLACAAAAALAIAARALERTLQRTVEQPASSGGSLPHHPGAGWAARLAHALVAALVRSGLSADHALAFGPATGVVGVHLAADAITVSVTLVALLLAGGEVSAA